MPTETQVLWFRAQRNHLAGDGANDVAEAARDILGAQAQQEPPALHALSMRTRSRPSATAVADAIYESGRSLVRCWGQRGTLHLYEARDWPHVTAARGDWSAGGRRECWPRPETAAAALTRMVELGTPVTRSDVFDLVPAEMIARVPEPFVAYVKKREVDVDAELVRFCAGRILMHLVVNGDAAVAHKVGSEQAYVARQTWFPDLPWSTPEDVQVALTRRYLRANGPVTYQDVAHHLGAKRGDAKKWLAALDPVTVQVEGRTLAVLPEDRDALEESPGNWPARLLPMFDTHLMGHADKSWTVPDEAERKAVWKKAAQVSPVVLWRGRVVGTWAHKKRTRSVKITVTPLSGWDPTIRADVEADAERFAAHLGLTVDLAL